MRFKNSEIPDSAFMTPGNYWVKIMSYREGMSDNGKQFTEFVFENDSGEKHVERFFHGALWRFKQLSIAVGIDKGAEWETEDLLHKEIEITLIEQEYQGKIYTRIGKIKKIAEAKKEDPVDPF